MRAAPVTVRGAFGFGLKAIAKAMHDHGLIETVWAEGPTDGMGALVGAFWCDAEAARTGVPMPGRWPRGRRWRGRCEIPPVLEHAGRDLTDQAIPLPSGSLGSSATCIASSD